MWCHMKSAILDQLIESIGEVDTAKLVESFGGSSWWIPVREFSAEHQFRQKLGAESLARLIQDFGNSKIAIPKATHWTRNREIAQQRPNATIRDLALRHRLSERQVYRVLAA